MTTITVSVSFDSTSTNPEVTTVVALLLASLGVSAPHDVVMIPAKARKERTPLTEEQKQVIRDRFAKGKAKAQAKRDAEVAKAKPADKPAKLTSKVIAPELTKVGYKPPKNQEPVVKGVRPQPAPKK